MSDTEWQVEMRTCFLRLDIVVLLHCLNLFIPIETIERDVSVLLHLYIIPINKKAKGVEISLPPTHAKHKCAQKTSCNEYHLLFQVGFVFLFSLFFLLPREWKKNDCMNSVV